MTGTGHGGARPAGTRGTDLLRSRRLASWVSRPSWQFQLVLPTQVLFWVVVVTGLVGPSDPRLNVATTLTWSVWFCLVFVLVIGTGRGWCLACPFGGLAEWVQRRRPWHRGDAPAPLGLNLPFPQRLARYGFLLPVATFAVLTWVEEYLDVAAPGPPPLTSLLVLTIIGLAVGSFLVFERRSFCRYLCPLSALIGVLGRYAPVTGFRARDPELCRTCRTRDCLHGNEHGYGCPWLTWPAQSGSTLTCGLCGECFRTCRLGNVGLMVTRPLAGEPREHRRADVAWAVAWLAGIVVFQQVNATDTYQRIDHGLNALTGIPHYPDPLGYLGTCALVAALTAVPAWLASRAWLVPDAVRHPRDDSFVYRTSEFRVLFLPLMYALIPLTAADYLARQLPKFLTGGTDLIPAVARLLGSTGSTGSWTAGPGGAGGVGGSGGAGPGLLVAVQVLVVVAGTLASVRLVRRLCAGELRALLRSPQTVTVWATGFTVALGMLVCGLYLAIGGAA